MRAHTVPPSHLRGKALSDWLEAEACKNAEENQARTKAIQYTQSILSDEEETIEALWGISVSPQRPEICALGDPIDGSGSVSVSGQTPAIDGNKQHPGTEATTALVSIQAPDSDSTSIACIQENPRDFKRESKRESKDAYKSHTRAEAGTVSFPNTIPYQKLSKDELERDRAAGIAWLLLDDQLRKVSKKERPFRNRFELARLAKFAATHGIPDTKVRFMATELMIPWSEVEEVIGKVIRQPNENLFDLAIQQGKNNVTGLETLDPALHKVACLAFQLQVFARDGTIYLVQNKIAAVFKTNQSTISRVIKHLKESGWLVEVKREKRRHRDFVRYQCPPAMRQQDKDQKSSDLPSE